MTYNGELSVLECISSHLKSFFRNYIFIEWNEVMHLGVWIELWMWVYVVYVGKVYELIMSNDFWFMTIYIRLIPKFNFFYNSGSNQDIFILFEDLSSVDLDLFYGYLNL